MSLINTRMQNIRATSDFDKNEYRPSRYGAFDMFMMQTNDPAGIISSELEQKAFQSIGRTIEVPVINFDSDISIGNTRTITIPHSENTSALVTVSFATYAWGFTIIPSQHMNNEISIQKDFEKKFIKYLYLLAGTLESSAVATLSANKTQVFKDILTYQNVANVLGASWQQRETLIGDLNVIMGANDYYGRYHLVGNAGVESIIRKLAQHGLYNDQMKYMEYSDKILHFSNTISNADNKFGSGYMVEAGNLGILTRVERESILRSTTGDGHEWDIDTLPMLNLPVGTYYYDEVEDVSTMGDHVADLTRARVEHYGFAVDVAFVVAYNSSPATLPNPILAFDIAVEAPVVPVSGVTLDEDTATIFVGNSVTLEATIAPVNATNQGVAWTSSNTAVATVDANGKVTGVGAGTATITVITADGAETDECTVTVVPFVPVADISLSENVLTLAVNGEKTLTVTFDPANASIQEVTWESDDDTVATVDEDGKVKGIGAGTANITATSVDGGKTDACIVTVTGT
jgi:hypothetical protein